MRVSARFEKIEEIKQLFPEEAKVVGVGVTAWPRSGLSYILPNYWILSLLETADLEAIRKICPVISVIKGLGDECPEKFNTSSILGLKEARQWLGRQKPDLFVYKDSEAIDREAERLGLKILGTPGKIRKIYENKKFFREELVKAGLKPIQGRTLKVDELDEKKWDECKIELGEKLVFQLTDYSIGGGLGTFFINNREDFKNFKEFVIRRSIRFLKPVKDLSGFEGIHPQEIGKSQGNTGRRLEWVNVTKFIEGEAASILGCVTKFGTVTGKLQKQIIDQPELTALHGRSGVWLGHDWNLRFSPAEQDRTEKLCQQWGNYIYKQGYKGVFGLDVVVDDAGQVYPVECNSRYTGAFPMYTMMQINNHEMPLDGWHLLEWLGVDYEMDIEAVRQAGRKEKQGAQLLLHNLERKTVTATKTVKAGVYQVNPAFAGQGRLKNSTNDIHHSTMDKSDKTVEVEWVRPGFSLLDIKNKDEFVLCDRVAGENCLLKPAERLGRLIFKRRVIDEKGRLLPEIQKVVKAVYEGFELMPICEGGPEEEN